VFVLHLMHFTRKYSLFCLVFFFYQGVFAQRLVDKMGIYFAPGLVSIPEKEELGSYNIPQNAFGGYQPGLSFDFCVYYYQNYHLAYGLDAQYFLATKKNYALHNTSVGPIVKYNILPTTALFSPFAIVGLKFGYTFLSRSAYNMSVQPSIIDPKQVEIQNVNLKFGYSEFAFPSAAPMVGIGFDFWITRRWKMIAMGTYTYQLTKSNSKLRDNYPVKQSNLGFVTVQAGISFKLTNDAKPKKNINNLLAQESGQKKQEAKNKIAAAAAQKYVTQKMPSINAQATNKVVNMKFKTLSKEGFDLTKKYTVNGQVKGAEGQNVSDLSVLIMDEKGQLVATAKTDKNGRYAYKGLKADNYSISLKTSDPQLIANANMSVEDASAMVDAASMLKFHYNRLSTGKHHGIVMGEVKQNADGVVAADETMLLLDSKGNLVGSTQTNKDGKYAFRNLKTDSYQVVSANNPNVKINSMAGSADPNMRVDEALFMKYPFRKLANGQKPEGVVTGKISTMGVEKDMSDQTVLLLDKNGAVVAQSKVNKEGRFAFKGLKPDGYQTVVMGNDPNIVAKTYLSTTDASLLMPESAFSKFGTFGSPGTPGKFITGNVTLPVSSQSALNASVLLLDDKGNVVESAKLGAQGNFVIRNIRAASYQVVVEGTDYEKMVFDVGKNDAANSSLSATAFSKYNFSKLNADGSFQNLVVGKIDVGGQFLPEEGVNVMLIDEAGNAVARSTADKNGNFAFQNVKAGNYQAVVEGQDYKKVTMNVANTDNAAKLSSQEFSKYGTDATPQLADKMVVGKVNSSVNGKSAVGKNVLLLDGNGNVVGKTVVGKNGSFIFHGLKIDNYQIVMEEPDPAFKTSLSAIVRDPEMKISIKDVMKFNPISKQMEKLTEQDNVIITGAIRSEDFMGAENRSVLLLDKEGKVVKEVTSDKFGVFKFAGIQAKDYQVAYESGQKRVTPVMQMYKDNDPAVTEQGGKIANTLYYNHNQTNITEADKAELEKFVRFFKEHPNMKMIKLNAYGDATGTDEANMEVTQKRAKAVMEYLQNRGIPADRLKLNPLGKSLKFKNKYSVPDPKLNRKVDIEVVE